jgi:hypothetical protein
MKRNLGLSIAILLICVAQSIAQTKKPAAGQKQPAVQDLAVTNEELVKYATVMDSVNEMQATVRRQLGEMVKNSTVMKSARYNELSKIIDDAAKLTEAKATPEEIAFVKEVAAKRAEETTRIKTTYQALATDYVKPAVFNKVKKAIDTDPIIKKRYDSLMVEMGKDDTRTQQ